MKKLFGKGKSDGEKEFKLKYRLGETIGSGAFASVKEGVEIATGTPVAVKVIKKKGLSADAYQGLMKEVQMLGKLSHPHILKMLDHIDTSANFYIVMELCTGGELFDRIVERQFYSEKDAAELTSKITGAVKYLHENGIVHRDLKPENLIYEDSTDQSDIKIADFGLAARSEQDSMSTACGTPGYVAPEVLTPGARYDQKVDMWSIGVILYILLCGFPPFYDENQHALFEQIKRGDYDFPSPHWDQVSRDAKDLVKRLLTVSATKRYSPDDVFEHPWMKNASTTQLEIKQELKAFNARRKFKKNVNAVIASNKFRMLMGANKAKSEDGGASAQ